MPAEDDAALTPITRDQFDVTTPRQWWIYLRLAEPTTAAELAEQAGVPEASIRIHLSKMVSNGIITQIPAVDPRTARYRRTVAIDRSQWKAALRKAGDEPLMTTTGALLPKRVPRHEGFDRHRRRGYLVTAGAILAVLASLAAISAITGPPDELPSYSSERKTRPNVADTPPEEPRERRAEESSTTAPRERGRSDAPQSPEPDHDTVRLSGRHGTYQVPRRAVTLLDRLGQFYGYLFESDREAAAFLGVYVCESVAHEGSTWDQMVQEDIDTGAPPSDARGYMTHIREEFCPLLGL